MAENIKYDVDFTKLIYENKMMSVYELRVLHLGTNANGYVINRDVVEKSIDKFYNLPLYCILNDDKSDFEEHQRGENDKNHTIDDIRVLELFLKVVL